MNRSVIVAKIEPAAEQEVTAIWAESDRTELPRLAGVLHRSLYRLGDLYVHLLETAQPGATAIEAARRHPEFARVSQELSRFITPYLADWKSPQDAQARCFYEWSSPAGTRRRAGRSR
jgi:cyclase